jgi:hypothetical protein
MGMLRRGIFAKKHTQSRYTTIIHCTANGNTRFVNGSVGYTTRLIRARNSVGLSIQEHERQLQHLVFCEV